MTPIGVLRIDIAKQIFHVVGMDDTGTVVLRKCLPMGALMPFIAQMPPVVIGMEACGGVHYWARRFREHGHCVRLMAPQLAALRAASITAMSSSWSARPTALKDALGAVAAT